MTDRPAPRGRAFAAALAAALVLVACGGGSSGEAQQALPPAQDAAMPVTSVTAQGTAATAQANVPVSFGQVFKPGDMPSAASLVAVLDDGTRLPTQADVKARHADGSWRHAVVSTVVPALPASQTARLTLSRVAQAAASNASWTVQDVLAGGFSLHIDAVIGGTTYSADAAELLQGTNASAWLSGPVVREWQAWAPLKTAAGVEHPHLVARIGVRSHGASGPVRADVVIENGWAYESGPSNLTYDVRVHVGGVQVYAKDALNHFHHARWRKTFWWGTAPQVHVKHDTAYLIASKALPNFDQRIVISESALASLATRATGANFEPMGRGLAVAYMPTTGGRDDIGLLPGWAAAYLLSMDERAKTATLAAAEQAGSWSIHYRDRVTGQPASVVDWPYMTILGRPGDTMNPVTKKSEAFPACGGTCTNANTADSAHQPAFSYLPYLVTGDKFHLEELQFWAAYNVFQHNPAYRGHAKGWVKADQVRGQGWSLRTIAEAAYITPDDDRLKAHFNGFVKNSIAWYDAAYTNNAGANVFGFVESNALGYNGGTGIAPWQDDFFTAAIGHVWELGFAEAKPLLDWKARFPVARMVDPGYCWVLGAAYSLNMRATATAPFFTTMGEVHDASIDAATRATACGSDAMAAALGLKRGEMTGYSSAATGYPSNMQPALAYAKDAGIAGAVQAWDVFDARTVKPNYTASPQFAIVPR